MENKYCILDFLSAKYFFKVYCPTVKSWVHKQRGWNGRGNPVVFSDEDIAAIEKGLVRMHEDFVKRKRNFNNLPAGEKWKIFSKSKNNITW